ncbi:MAG: cob(I)yrinic acid a,c-diamide adenosyltransferase [Candidatus Omnitrophota bacterium]|jgi:cob(I)alamin adenosyltransferase|nr:MAG: cob(I)yrinic acid a,c-diamide adenosyltransferase [Candidatus Omnitrophota bacterium]
MKKNDTQFGDYGFTQVGKGTRVSKDSPRVHACGTTEELNSFIGLAISLGLSPNLIPLLLKIQDDLFGLTADLATTANHKKNRSASYIDVGHVKMLDEEINRLSEVLKPSTQYILPGGALPAAVLHLARNICRRLERCAVTLYHQEEISEFVLEYLNRLSDLLLVMARYQNRQDGVEESEWTHKAKEEKTA